MKVCIPIISSVDLKVNPNIKELTKIIIFDLDNNDFFVTDISDKKIKEVIKYLVDNKVQNIIIERTVLNYYKYIKSKNIEIYSVDAQLNALENIDMLKENKLSIIEEDC